MFGMLRFGFVALLAFVAIELLVSLAIVGRSLDYYFFGFSGWRIAIWTSPLLIWLGILSVKITLRRIDRPTLTIWRVIRRERHWLLRAALFASLITPFARSYGAIKASIPHLRPFYADPLFVEWDRALFFGIDPWVLTHAFIGPFGTMIIDRIYILWFFFASGLVAWFLFTRDPKFQLRGFVALFLTWSVLGNVFAVLFSSVGPCFYQPIYGQDYYAGLMYRLDLYDASYGLRALFAQEYLLTHRSADNFGAGISAMPSLHVAVAFLTWLCCRMQIRARWASYFAFVYFLVICVGSVHLGWHYAVDGIVSVIGVALIWWGSGRFVDWVEAREARLSRVKPDRRGANGPAPAFATPE